MKPTHLNCLFCLLPALLISIASPRMAAADPREESDPLAAAEKHEEDPAIAEPGDERLGGKRLADGTLQLTLADCLRIAFEKHPDARRARIAVTRATADAKSIRGAYGPTLQADGTLMVWHDELVADFGGLDAEIEATTPPSPESQFDLWVLQQFVGLSNLMDAFGGASDMVLRKRLTYGVTLRLTQPLTPLYQVYQGYKARRSQVRQAEHHVATKQADIALQVVTAYYAVLQAQAYGIIAASAVEQIEAHLTRVRSFYEQGVVGKNELLKVKVELANAQKYVIEAESSLAVARANLAVQMGLDASEALTSAPDDPSDDLPVVSVTIEEARREALGRRTELLEIAAGMMAAEHGARAGWWDLVPQLVLLAQYDHVGGQGRLAQADSFFAGLALSWEVWDWGRKYHAARAGDLQVEEIRLQRERVEQLLQLDIADKYHRLRSAEKSFRVAQVSIEQAEEALRIERERFSVQAATTTEVLDAEANLTRARANRVNAYYGYMLARAELRRAMGLPLLADEE